MKSRNFGLDVLRCASIWLVLLSHLGYDFPALKPLSVGVLGVEVFFVMSGFLIGGILIREIDKGRAFWPTVRSFWVRRWYRILPLYYLAILFKFLVMDHSIGWNILYYVFFLQNNFFGVEFYSVTWSLVIEEWFYLVAPPYLYFAFTRLKSMRKLLIAIILFILAVVCARGGYALISQVPYSGFNGNFPFRFDALFLGVLMAFLRLKIPEFYKRLENVWLFALGGVLVISYLWLIWVPATAVGAINTNWLYPALGYFLVPFFISWMLPLSASWKQMESHSWYGKLFYQFVTRTSLYTYSLYLCHPLVFFYIKKHLKGEVDGIVLQIILMSGAYLVSALLYHGFEHPILKFRDRKLPGDSIFGTNKNKPGEAATEN